MLEPSGVVLPPLFKNGTMALASQVRDIVQVRIIRDKSRQSDPTLSRREGFNDYIFSHFPECELTSILIDPSRPESVTDSLKVLTRDRKLVVMFNSRIPLITDFLRKHPSEGRRVIGFDNLEKNVEAFQAVTTLADYIVKGKKPVSRDNYAHMDILTRLNIDNY